MGLVSIYSAMGEIEAQVIKSLLESMGIPAMLSSETYGRLAIPVFGGCGLTEVQVLVNEIDVEEAKEIISDTRIEPDMMEEDEFYGE